MDLKTIKNLLNLISNSDVNEVEIEEGNFKIKIKKQADTVYKEESRPFYMGIPQGMGSSEENVPPASTPDTSTVQRQSEDSPEENRLDDKHITVHSPIVGTFYTAPTPDSDPFVQVGDTISQGDVLCIIEAMKIMNEIESEHSGKIAKVLVENSQPVEYDQPLFLIEPA